MAEARYRVHQNCWHTTTPDKTLKGAQALVYLSRLHRRDRIGGGHLVPAIWQDRAD
jgi:hypothetical protein